MKKNLILSILMLGVMLTLVSALHSSSVVVDPTGWLKPSTSYDFEFTVTNTAGDAINDVTIDGDSQFGTLVCGTEPEGWSFISGGFNFCRYTADTPSDYITSGNNEVFALTAPTLASSGNKSWTITTREPGLVGTESNTVISIVKTIQSAITDASSGDTINIPAGTYDVTSVITVDKSLTIQGAGIDSTIITGRNKNAFITDGQDLLFDIQANNVIIKDMTIDLGDDTTDFDVGVFTGNDAGIHDLTIDNVKFLYAAFENLIGEQLIHLGGGVGTDNILLQTSIFETASGNSVWYVGDYALE